MSSAEERVKKAVLEERARILNIIHDAKLKNGFKTPLSTREEEFTGKVLENIVDAVHNKTEYQKVQVKLKSVRKGD